MMTLIAAALTSLVVAFGSQAGQGSKQVQDDPLATLMTPGNHWTYLKLDGFHDASTATSLQETISERKAVGDYVVATIKVVEGERSETHYRVRRENRTWRANPYEFDAFPSKEDVASIARQAPEVELTAGKKRRHQWVCTGRGCTYTIAPPKADFWRSGSYFDAALGVVMSIDAEYSEETGDGTTTIKLLMSQRLSPPAVLPTVTAESAQFAIFRKLFRDALLPAKRKALKALIQPDVVFSLHSEHTGRDLALATWDEQGALSTLSTLLEASCAQVSGSAEHMACPKAFADSLSVHSSKAKRFRGPRAVFTRNAQAWKLQAFIQGGAAEVLTTNGEDKLVPSKAGDGSKAP